jgi:hypothetical protein
MTEKVDDGTAPLVSRFDWSYQGIVSYADAALTWAEKIAPEAAEGAVRAVGTYTARTLAVVDVGITFANEGWRAAVNKSPVALAAIEGAQWGEVAGASLGTAIECTR